MRQPSKMQRRLRTMRSATAAVTVTPVASWSSSAQPLEEYKDAKTREAYEEEQDALKAARKGKQGMNCNRTDCQRPGAFFLNNGTSKYYCLDCTIDIGGFALRTSNCPMELYSNFDEDMDNYVAHLKEAAKPGLELALLQAQRAKETYAKARTIYHRGQGTPP